MMTDFYDTLEQRDPAQREAALLQTFPPDCILTDARATCMAYKPIGNAVPPLMARSIAKIIKNYI